MVVLALPSLSQTLASQRQRQPQRARESQPRDLVRAEAQHADHSRHAKQPVQVDGSRPGHLGGRDLEARAHRVLDVVPEVRLR